MKKWKKNRGGQPQWFLPKTPQQLIIYYYGFDPKSQQLMRFRSASFNIWELLRAHLMQTKTASVSPILTASYGFIPLVGVPPTYTHHQFVASLSKCSRDVSCLYKLSKIFRLNCCHMGRKFNF